MSAENVELIVRIRAEGQAVLNALRQAMSGLNQESKSTTTGVGQLDAAELKLAITLRIVTKATEKVTVAQDKHKQSMGMSVLQGILLSEVLGRIAGATKAATVEAAMYASRTEQLNAVMDQLARTNGLNVNAVRAQADAVKNLGITTQESRNTITQMIFSQLDLAKATDLARLAQNAAKVGGISSSEALNGIINGIKTQQIEVLRTYGIQVSFEQALARGAARLNKTRETLTDYERANIALNEVLSKGPRILGAYEVSLTTTAGQMQSLTRLVDEAKNAVGERFAPALQRVVEFLTSMATGVKDNADQVANLTTALTAAGAAAAAFRFTPGPVQVKGAAAASVGIGALLLGNVDAEAAAIDATKNAIAKIEKDRNKLVKEAQAGRITDKEAFLKENNRLKDLELQLEQQLTDNLAVEYRRRRENEGKGSYEFQFGVKDSISPIVIRRGNKDRGLFQGSKPTDPSDIDLGGGRTLRAAQIEQAIKDLGSKQTIDPDGLQFKQDPQAAIDAQFASFQSKLKEAQKSASSSLLRARGADLQGEAKVNQERLAALGKIFEEFKPFEASLRGGKDFQKLLGTINAEFDLLLDKERRSQKVESLKRGKRVEDTNAQIQVDRLRQVTQQAQEIAAVQAQPGNQEADINRLRKERLELARQEYEASKARTASELKALQVILDLDKNQKAFDEGQNQANIANLKTEAQLLKEKSDIEHDAQVAILKLRKEQRKELEQAYENARRIIETEQSLQLSRIKDNAGRAVRLVQATTPSGDERFSQEFQLRVRVDLARKEYQTTLDSIKEQRKASIEAYERTKDKVELERKAVEFRQRELKAEYDLEKEIADARLDREIQIAEIRKRQNEELRQSLGQIYNAARSAGRVGVKEFFQGYLDEIKKTIFVNLGEELFRGTAQKLGSIIPGQEKVDPITGKGTGELTTLGRILRGTPLGIDPAKLAADKQVNAQDRNTKAVDRLSDIMSGVSTPSAVGGTAGSSKGGLLDQIIGGSLGSILGLPGGNGPGMVIKNLTGGGGFSSSFLAEGNGGSSLNGVDLRPDRGLGGFLTKVTDFVRPKVDPLTGKGKFSAGNTALAAAAAIPGIIDGIQEGGLKGTLGSASGALGIAASIPGPQQPFLIAAALITGLAGGLMKSKQQKKEEALARALSAKFELPGSIDTVSDLAGNAVDYNSRGDIRAFRGNGVNVNVNVSAMDAKSFFDRGPELADSVMNMLQLGHPLRGQVSEIAGVA